LGYRLEAVVARKPVAPAFVARYPTASLVELKQGFALVPLTDNVIRRLSRGAPWDRGQLLHPQRSRLPHELAAALAALSSHGEVAYLEAKFFGGEGVQAAAVWADGVIVLGPIVEEDGEERPRRWRRVLRAVRGLSLHDRAINQALRRLGATVDRGAPDEFATLGLDRARHTEEWPPLA
jgi:hypothetical protein